MEKLEYRIQKRFVKAFATYQLIEDGDRILVGLSGGKDSLCLLELLAKRAKIQHPKFEVEALHVRISNIAYETNTSYLQEFCNDLGVRLHIVTTSFEVNSEQDHQLQRKQKSPCFLCSWNRRKQLFLKAQELNCNKIALGHHQDDIIHTAMLNIFFQGHFMTMPIRLKMRKMPITIIRPLCLEQEEDIQQWAAVRGYKKQVKFCPYEHNSYRTEMKQMFSKIEQFSSEARYSVWNALESEGKLIEE